MLNEYAPWIDRQDTDGDDTLVGDRARMACWVGEQIMSMRRGVLQWTIDAEHIVTLLPQYILVRRIHG